MTTLKWAEAAELLGPQRRRTPLFDLRPLMETRWEEDPAGEPDGTEPSDTQASERQLGGGPLCRFWRASGEQ